MRKEDMWLCPPPHSRVSRPIYSDPAEIHILWPFFSRCSMKRKLYIWSPSPSSCSVNILWFTARRAACGFVYSWESEKNFSGRDQIHPDDCSKCLSDGAWMWLTLYGAKCGDDKAPKQSSSSGFGVYDFWWGCCLSIFVWVVFPSIQIHRSEYRCFAKQIGPKNKSFENWHILPLTWGSVYVKVVTGMKALILSCLWLWMTHIHMYSDSECPEMLLRWKLLEFIPPPNYHSCIDVRAICRKDLIDLLFASIHSYTLFVY